jgi:hypothetical protein
MPPMRFLSLATLWTAIKTLVAGLGGLAGIKMIFDFLTRGPKFKSFWIRDWSCDLENIDTGEFLGTLLLSMIDVVNVRQHPVCIRNWDLEIHSRGSKGKIIMGQRWYIPQNFKIPTPSGEIDISKERLTEKTFNNPIEYGKIMRGWMGFSFPNLKQNELPADRYYVFIAEDVFGNRHRIKCKRPHVEKGDGDVYIEGSGQQVNKVPTYHFDPKSSPKSQT